MNISIIKRNWEDSLIEDKSTVLKPAVLAETLIKKEERIRSYQLYFHKPASLFHSVKIRPTVPKIMRKQEKRITSIEWTESLLTTFVR